MILVTKFLPHIGPLVFGIQAELTRRSQKKTVDELGLQPEGEARVVYGNGEAIAKFYIVSLVLPNLLHLPAVRVTEAATSEGFGVILGMDIISMGDFAITNVGGVSTFSFCVPGLETIDYLERIAGLENE